MTDLASGASTAVSTRALAEKPQGATTDEPVCRICLEGGDDDGEKGRLFVPCKCKGTVRFVHEHCLSEWRRRAVDQENRSLCVICGASYVLKQKKNSSERPLVLCAFLLLLLLSAILSPTTDYFLKVQNTLNDAKALAREQVSTSEAVTHTAFLLEATSAAGVLLGDCRGFSQRNITYVEVHSAQPLIRLGTEDQEPARPLLFTIRHPLSACGRRWALDEDAQRPSLHVRLIMSTLSNVINASHFLSWCSGGFIVSSTIWCLGCAFAGRRRRIITAPMLLLVGTVLRSEDRRLLNVLEARRSEQTDNLAWLAVAVLLLALVHLAFISPCSTLPPRPLRAPGAVAGSWSSAGGKRWTRFSTSAVRG
ncbi:hypothetical protein JCM10213_001860 [Rhodosporidiobolus nylandii]